MTLTIVGHLIQMEDEGRVVARVEDTARSLLEDTLRASGYPTLAGLLKSYDDTLQGPKPILIAYNYDAYEIKYLSAAYSEEIIALDGKYLGVHYLTSEQEEIVTELNTLQPLESVDLTLYSHIVTIGWLFP